MVEVEFLLSGVEVGYERNIMGWAPGSPIYICLTSLSDCNYHPREQ